MKAGWDTSGKISALDILLCLHHAVMGRRRFDFVQRTCRWRAVRRVVVAAGLLTEDDLKQFHKDHTPWSTSPSQRNFRRSLRDRKSRTWVRTCRRHMSGEAAAGSSGTCFLSNLRRRVERGIVLGIAYLHFSPAAGQSYNRRGRQQPAGIRHHAGNVASIRSRISFAPSAFLSAKWLDMISPR